MREKYNHKEIEKKWNDRWFASNLYEAKDFSEKPKKYILVEFPYPSGSGLHCGHVYRFTMPDVYARKLRMDGYNVLFPIGWDAFGLPAENYAVKTGVHPAITTQQAIDTFKTQMRMLGFSFDWARELSTTDSTYYKWTQWIFLKFWEAGLAELTEQPVWWCEALRTVLANEEVLDDGKGGKISERGGHPVEKRSLKQWVLKLPAYAEKLLAGLEHIEFPESVKSAQRSWIGKSVGAEILFPLSVPGKHLEVFTTRPDTLLGATFMVLAPEHPLIDELKSQIKNWEEVTQYRNQVKNRSDLERKSAKEKTGVKLIGVEGKNPIDPSGPAIPLMIADYVLMDYGTGAIMAVPAHDERDFEFATKFDLPIVQTITAFDSTEKVELPYPGETGQVLLDSRAEKVLGEELLRSVDRKISCDVMKEFVISTLEKQGLGKREINYKIRDWLFSRQRYWGEPIPLVHCQDGTIEPLVRTTDKAKVNELLPLELPLVPDYLPSSDGYSPLGKNQEWVSITDSKGQPAKRETNTMPNWAGSCWYYLRYIDPHNNDEIASADKLNYWLPVDRYFGGSEHTTLHLLYSRFWHVFLHDQGIVPTAEPYAWRMNGGVLLGPDSQKMSKSLGNVINPDEKVEQCGADALRLYINFMGPYDGTLPWSENGLKACRKLVERIFDLRNKVGGESSTELKRSYHKLVKRTGDMINNLKTNTVVSELMIFVRDAEAAEKIDVEIWKGFLRVLAPMAVFIAEELWQEINGYTEWTKELSVHLQQWPKYDEELAKDEFLVIGVQVNGKLRDQVEVTPEEDESSVKQKVLASNLLQKWIEGKEIKKFVYVKGRIVNLVVG